MMFAPKFSKIPPYFSTFVRKSVSNCVSDHGCIGFVASVSKSIGTVPTDRQSDRRALWNVHHPSMNESVYSSVIMARAVIFLQLSVKYQRVQVRRYTRRWLWQNAIMFLQLSVKYRRETFHRYTRRWLWKNAVIVLQLSVKYRRVTFRRYSRR